MTKRQIVLTPRFIVVTTSTKPKHQIAASAASFAHTILQRLGASPNSRQFKGVTNHKY